MRYNVIKYFFIFFIIVLFSCKNIDFLSSKKNIVQKEILPQIKKFDVVRTKDGCKVLELKGEIATVDEEKNLVSITSGIVKIYNKGKYVALGNFKEAILYIENNNIIFKGENIINTVENEKIITYDMKYIATDNKIFSNKEIIIYKDNNVIKGIGFETTNGFKTIKIWQNIITEG